MLVARLILKIYFHMISITYRVYRNSVRISISIRNVVTVRMLIDILLSYSNANALLNFRIFI